MFKYGEGLQKELENFLEKLDDKPTLANVTPRDICRFLVFKDNQGKTKTLNDSALRLKYTTVEKHVRTLRSIFLAIGRDPRLVLGDREPDHPVQEYLKAIKMEQRRAGAEPDAGEENVVHASSP